MTNSTPSLPQAILLAICLALPLTHADTAREQRTVIVVLGTEGADEFADEFASSAQHWREACEQGGAQFVEIGTGPAEEGRGESDRDRVKEAITSFTGDEVWLVLIGHGTFDGREAKFNLRGPDFSDTDLAEWLGAIDAEAVVINTASASGSFVSALSGERRIVITATKSPTEVFFTRFGRHFAEAIGGLSEADLDNDEQVSLLESYLHAAGQVRAFYENEGRLATEHALLDDNGDGLGTRAEWFEGTTAVRVAREGAEPDGERARQRALVRSDFERNLTRADRERRDELERKVRDWRRKKEEIYAGDYYDRLEEWLTELARIYQRAESS